MKKIASFLFCLTLIIAHGQKDETKASGTNQNTLDAARKNEFSPYVYIGKISSNTGTSNFGVDLAEQTVNLKGILYSSKTGFFVLGAEVKGDNENGSLGIFGEGKLNPKLTGDLSVTFNLKPIVKYTVINEKLLTTNTLPTYEKIIEDTADYSANNLIHYFITFGVKGEGAKYFLIDTTDNFQNMVGERKYSGWNFYGQLIRLDFHPKKKIAFLNSFRASYGELNNIEDLKDYTITNSTSYSSGNEGKKFERKVTGYFDEYFVQHQGILSYEANLFQMDTTALNVGLIAGADFVYNSKQKNYFRINAGLNFPIEIKQKDSQSRYVYIGAILSSIDPWNYRDIADFTFFKSLWASIRLVSPIKINYRPK